MTVHLSVSIFCLVRIGRMCCLYCASVYLSVVDSNTVNTTLCTIIQSFIGCHRRRIVYWVSIFSITCRESEKAKVNATYCLLLILYILRARVITVEVELISETHNTAGDTTNTSPSEQVPEPRYYNILSSSCALCKHVVN